MSPLKILIRVKKRIAYGLYLKGHWRNRRQNSAGRDVGESFLKRLPLVTSVGLSVFLINQSELPIDAMGSHSHTAVVPIDGMIAPGETANAYDIQQNLEAAFEAPGSKGVMLEINSPGGSPVQSEYVYRAILDLKAQHPGKAVHAVIGDIGASGAYYIAAAADTIHAAPASIVGSIGVVASGFGFNELMEKLGVDRRVIAAGRK